MISQIAEGFLVAGTVKRGILEFFIIYEEGMARPGGFEPPTL